MKQLLVSTIAFSILLITSSYTGFESIYETKNSSYFHEYIDCGLNESMVMSGQYSSSELDALCQENKKKKQQQLIINIVIGVCIVIGTSVAYNQFTKSKK